MAAAYCPALTAISSAKRCIVMSSLPHIPCAVDAGRILEQDMAIFEKTLAVNYSGVVHTVKAAVPGMVARREGQVVIIASVMAIIGASPEVEPNQLPHTRDHDLSFEHPSLQMQSDSLIWLLPQVLRGMGPMLRPSGRSEVSPTACGTRCARLS